MKIEIASDEIMMLERLLAFIKDVGAIPGVAVFKVSISITIEAEPEASSESEIDDEA